MQPVHNFHTSGQEYAFGCGHSIHTREKRAFWRGAKREWFLKCLCMGHFIGLARGPPGATLSRFRQYKVTRHMSTPLVRKLVHHRVNIQRFVTCTQFYIWVKRQYNGAKFLVKGLNITTERLTPGVTSRFKVRGVCVQTPPPADLLAIITKTDISPRKVRLSSSIFTKYGNCSVCNKFRHIAIVIWEEGGVWGVWWGGGVCTQARGVLPSHL